MFSGWAGPCASMAPYIRKINVGLQVKSFSFSGQFEHNFRSSLAMRSTSCLSTLPKFQSWKCSKDSVFLYLLWWWQVWYLEGTLIHDLWCSGQPVDFVHVVSISGMKTMMEKQMGIYKNGGRTEMRSLTWEETVPGDLCNTNIFEY